MTARARYSTAKTSASGAFDADEDYAPGEFFPGERIGPPLSRTRGKSMLRSFVILSALGGGWALLNDPSTSSRWWSAVTAAVSPAIERAMLGSPAPSTSAATHAPPAIAEPATKPAVLDTPPSSPQPPASSTTAATPSATVELAEPPLTTAALPPAAKAVDEPPAPPLQPATPDPTDPYQMRAAAVGLHPYLSRVLLTRLSPTDYRNAGMAIQTAVAETPDTAIFVWPRQRKPELALFQVRFVPGAAPDCRRYVVTVTKDGWSTTALPMEKCGSARGRPRSK